VSVNIMYTCLKFKGNFAVGPNHEGVQEHRGNVLYSSVFATV